MGFYNTDNEFYRFCTENSIDSEFVIAAIEVFIVRVDKPTVLVLDNASFHKSKVFLEKVQEWMEKDLYVFYLPKYSPHLNRIETLWRFIKYQWLEVDAYSSWKNLVNNLNEIFDQIGTMYTINFNKEKDG